MDTSKMKNLFRNINLSISLFIIASVILQFLLIVLTIGAVWVVDVLLPLTTVIFVLNLGFGVFVLFLILFKRRKEHKSVITWIFLNQILILFGLIILFASGMTLANF